VLCPCRARAHSQPCPAGSPRRKKRRRKASPTATSSSCGFLLLLSCKLGRLGDAGGRVSAAMAHLKASVGAEVDAAGLRSLPSPPARRWQPAAATSMALAIPSRLLAAVPASPGRRTDWRFPGLPSLPRHSARLCGPPGTAAAVCRAAAPCAQPELHAQQNPNLPKNLNKLPGQSRSRAGTQLRSSCLSHEAALQPRSPAPGIVPRCGED